MLNFCLTRCLICDGHLQKYDTVGPVLINSDGNIRDRIVSFSSVNAKINQ